MLPADLSYRNFDVHLSERKHPTERLLRMSRSLGDAYATLRYAWIVRREFRCCPRTCCARRMHWSYPRPASSLLRSFLGPVLGRRVPVARNRLAQLAREHRRRASLHRHETARVMGTSSAAS